MTKPILYYTIISPASRGAWLTAKALDLDIELRNVDVMKGEQLTEEFIKMNPQHTVPTLDDNGAIVYESHAVSAYLVEKYGSHKQSLYPKDLIKRALVDARCHFNTGYLFARMRSLYEPILRYNSMDCPTEKVVDMQKPYQIMEDFLKDGDYLCGNEMTIADLCCVATITSMDEVAPIDPIKCPKVLAWIERLSLQLPYYKEVNEIGAEELKKMIRDVLAGRNAN